MTRSLPVLSRVTAVLVACTWFLIVFGASVRVHGAGLACPDWPLCFGEVIPPIDFGVALEFGHRVVAGLISLGFAAVLVGVLRARAEAGRRTVWIALLAAVVLVVQVILGGLTVLELLAEWTVTSHLLAGNTFCMLLLLLSLSLREAHTTVDRTPISWAARSMGLGLGGVVVAQLALGGLVSSSYAGLACGTWPTCDGTSWFPTFQGLVGLQLMHRLLAYGVLVASGVAWAMARTSPRAGRAAAVVFVAVLFQATIGVANVLLRLPVEVTLLHSFGAAGVWLSTAYLNWELLRAPVPADVPVASAELEVA